MSGNSILIVDDDPIELECIEQFADHADYQVLTARDGAAALEVLNAVETLPVGVLTDLRMPRMDGLELLSRLQKDFPRLPVAILTGHSTLKNTIEALKFGAVDYLIKPVSAAMISSLIERFATLQNSYVASLAKTGLLLEKSARYVVSSDRQVPGQLARIVTGDLQSWLAREPLKAIQLQLSLIEALENALVHGNLEVSSACRDESMVEYDAQIRERLTQVDLRKRTITVDVRMADHTLSVVVTDEGRGFDFDALPQDMDFDVLQSHGRGIFLIRNFFDCVQWSDGGRTISMQKSLH